MKSWTYTHRRFVPKASVQGVKVLGEETSDLLQAINLEIWRLLNHIPGGGDWSQSVYRQQVPPQALCTI